MTPTDQAILDYIAAHPGVGRDKIQRHIAREVSTTTIWRALRRLVDEGKLEVTGKGRTTGYHLAGAIAVRAYLQTPSIRRKPVNYHKEFIDLYIPDKTFYLSAAERKSLHEAGQPDPSLFPAGSYACHILERLLVDLSWASSRLEGNTYNIAETERLIRFGQEASGKEHWEAVMILNHKEAIQYLVDNLVDITITRRNVCNIHALLADGLLIDPAMAGRLRRMPVGITHSCYRPLGDRFAIEEEFDIVLQKAAAIPDPFEQSFFLLVHLPYLQAFDDVNKRTSRIVSNIPLLKAALAPLSFTTVNDGDYTDGLIGVYELNNVSLLREVFIEAYITSAENYRVIRAEVKTPEKAASVYRDFVREAVRCCVLELKAFLPEKVKTMTIEAGIPEEDRDPVVDYVGREFHGLHEGNVIRYRLRPEDLVGIKKG